MFGRETRMLLRHYLEHGTSKSALARELGVSRDTIHRWIRDGDLDRDLDALPVQYGPRRPPPTKLDPYRAIIETRLAARTSSVYPSPRQRSAPSSSFTTSERPGISTPWSSCPTICTSSSPCPRAPTCGDS